MKSITPLQAEQIEAAIRLATEFHCGQRDKEGQPYLLHLMRVAIGFSDPDLFQAALLHDLLEDTSATIERLQAARISPAATQAIQLLTRTESERYETYILRIATNPIAKQVKLADLRDNYSIDRVAYRQGHQAEDANRIQQYILAYQFLSGLIEESSYLHQASELKIASS